MLPSFFESALCSWPPDVTGATSYFYIIIAP